MSYQFLNSMYKRSKMVYDTFSRKYIVSVPDILIFTLKNTETLETELKIIENPDIDYYLSIKPQSFQKFSLPFEEVRKVTCKYSDREKDISSRLGLLENFFDSKKKNNFYEFKKELMRNPNLYYADTDIEDHYKTKCILKYGIDTVASSYKMAFSDIEVDISNYDEGFADADVAPCPIYLITTIFDETKEVYSFILWDERCGDDIKEIMSDPDKFVNENIDECMKKIKFSYNFNVYSTEGDLIESFFKTVHDKKADFMAWWNMPFDIPTILNRLKRLGYNDEQISNIVCHPDVPEKYRYYQYNEDPKRAMFRSKTTEDDEDDEDETSSKSKNSQNKPHPSRLVDWFNSPGYTQHYDQLSMFSCLRKRYLLPSYKLDDIGKEYGGIGKIDLSDLGYSIKDVNVKNFKLCLAYNIRDTFVQWSIENKQRDMTNHIISSSNTKLSKGHSMSIVIKNEIMLYLITQENQIMGNALTYDIPHESLQGAIVGKPELVEQLGIMISDFYSYVFEDCIDLDAASLYPSLMITFNIFKSALFGRILKLVDNNGFDYSKADDLLEMIQTIDQSLFTICSKYLKLPTPTDIIKNIEKFSEKKYICSKQ